MLTSLHRLTTKRSTTRTVLSVAAIALVATGAQAAQAAPGDPGATAAPEQQVTAAVAEGPAAYTHDWDGDGAADLLATTADGTLRLYAGNGAGGFVRGTGQQIGRGWQAFDELDQVGDWDGDGTADLIARAPGTAGGELRLYQGNGYGGFAPGTGTRIGYGWSVFDEIVAPGDWTGDGWPDLIARRADTQVLYVYPGYGVQGFGKAYAISGRFALSEITAVGDFTGDDNADLVAVLNGQLRLYPGDGAGAFARGAGAVIGQSGWGGLSMLVGPGDWTGDGTGDLIARDGTGRLFLFYGNGSGGFSRTSTGGYSTQIGSGWGAMTHIV